jgi:outer membrane protein assembly factor BamA
MRMMCSIYLRLTVLLFAPAALVIAAQPASAADVASANAPLDVAALEASGAHIGTITIKTRDIFDLDNPDENRALFRLANRWHRRTRDGVLSAQLLFASGDLYSQRLLDETERNLRELHFLREPKITVTRVHDGLVDVEVLTHDVWTLQVGPGFSRSGGTNETSVSFEDKNFLGLGKTIVTGASTNVDRRSTIFEWRDPNILGGRWRDNLYWSDNSDGHVRRVQLWRPFYALDVRHSFGLLAGDAELLETRYRLGVAYDSYRHRQQTATAYAGWSSGLRAGMTRRLTLGWSMARDNFDDIASTTLAAAPQNRRLNYPWVRLDWISDHFHTTRNLDLIARTEDQQLGFSGSVVLGAASRRLGSDRNATIVGSGIAYGRDIATRQQLFFSAAVNTRVEQGRTRDVRTTTSAAWYWRTSPRTVMHSKLMFARGSNLDLDHYSELGGDTGLRGYPLRYQQGTGLTLFKLEERAYSRWTLWHLFDIGGAAFFDAGRVHGSNPIGAPNLGWLKDVGIGLRLGNSRSSLGNVLHVDLATPLDGEKRLNRLQFLVSTEATF